MAEGILERPGGRRRGGHANLLVGAEVEVVGAADARDRRGPGVAGGPGRIARDIEDHAAIGPVDEVGRQEDAEGGRGPVGEAVGGWIDVVDAVEERDLRIGVEPGQHGVVGPRQRGRVAAAGVDGGAAGLPAASTAGGAAGARVSAGAACRAAAGASARAGGAAGRSRTSVVSRRASVSPGGSAPHGAATTACRATAGAAPCVAPPVPVAPPVA